VERAVFECEIDMKSDAGLTDLAVICTAEKAVVDAGMRLPKHCSFDGSLKFVATSHDTDIPVEGGRPQQFSVSRRSWCDRSRRR